MWRLASLNSMGNPNWCDAIQHKAERFASADSMERVCMLRRALFRYGIVAPVDALLLLTALLVAGILLLFRPVIAVRFGRLPYDRIGHLSSNTEWYLRHHQRCPGRRREYPLLVADRPVNSQLANMIRRRLPVVESRVLLRVYRLLERHVPNLSLLVRFNEEGYGRWMEWDLVSPQLRFSTHEEQAGNKLLDTMGIPRGASFVCFHARDAAYLNQVHLWRTREQWSYHDYRDADINNYLSAAAALAQDGVWALRMGAVVSRPIHSLHSRVIDYATDHRSDLGDIYLASHCKFFLSGSAGIDRVAMIFNVPIAAANGAPVGFVGGWRRSDIFIPKKYRDAMSKQPITFREIIDMGADRWLSSDKFNDAGIELVENSADEIRALALEMNARIDGAWTPEDDDEELQQVYRSMFPTDHPATDYPSRAGAEFLRKNLDLFE